MKKTVLVVLLIPLLLLEMYLCTVFLPLHWQHEINGAIVRLLPERHDQTPITHPMLDQEIEQALREQVWLRVSLYLVDALLLAANAWTIYRLMHLARHGSGKATGDGLMRFLRNAPKARPEPEDNL